MKLNGTALAFSLSAVMLAGCGGVQNGMVTPVSSAQAKAHRGSWMLPEAKGEDLVYISSFVDNVYVFSYPKLKQVGDLKGAGGFGLCSDKNGNVFVPSYYEGGKITEYAHGGSSPIATLPDSGDGYPFACSVDPTTGNLAVTNQFGSGSCGDSVAVYENAQGTPTTYCAAPIIGYIWFCGYDNAGNLFVDGNEGNDEGPFVLAELPSRGNGLTPISVSQKFNEPGQVQWNGSNITVEDDLYTKIYAFQISGSSAQVIQTTTLKGVKKARQSWIQGGKVLVPFGTSSGITKLGVWKYPSGGNASAQVKHIGRRLAGVTVSVAPTASRIRK